MLLTMFDGRTNLAIQVAQEVKRFFPGKVYATVIPRMCGFRRHPATESPSPPMTAAAVGLRPMCSWRRSF